LDAPETFRPVCIGRPGDLIIMPPTSSETGERNTALTADLVVWNRSTRAGRVFEPSTGFILPNGAKRSPDAS